MSKNAYNFEPETLINKGKTGILNLGNTCYINSASQCLSHTVKLRDFFLSGEYEKYQNNEHKSSVLVDEWYDMLTRLWDNHRGVAPRSYVKNVQRIYGEQGYFSFTGFEQNDAQEYLNLFMDQMHEVLSRKVNMKINGDVKNEKDKLLKKAYENWKLYYENSYSKFVDLFHGQMMNLIDCPETKEKSYSFEPFSSLQLSLENSQNNTHSLYDCLDNYTKYSILDGDNAWYSEAAKEKKKAFRYVRFWRMPNYLMIVLKRFTNNGNKIMTKVEYPMELDMSKYCVLKEERTNYRLYGVINHFGGVNGGHYTAYCRNGEQWREFDDLDVKDITEETALNNKVVAYVLFYELV